MEIPENILVLIEKYQTGKATAEEKMQLDEWYHSFNDNQVKITTSEIITEEQLAEKIKSRVFETINEGKKPISISRSRFSWKLTGIAASFLILLSLGVYLLNFSKPLQKEVAVKIPVKGDKKNDIAPGGNKAILMLADGTSIVLDSVSKGIISQQGKIDVQKLGNGQLSYTMQGGTASEINQILYNRIATPRGGQYQVTLSDGTKVWLNAASSIRFPVAFSGTYREVEITGEAYFEVAKNKEKPFIVKTISSTIEVLGTHFNVNAYEDEAVAKTTLLEGSVKISVPALTGSQSQKYLLPGQQALVIKDKKLSVVENADTEEAIAWMNGHFQFSGSDLKTILRQISRWYDVDIEYRGNVNLHFTGQLTRNDYVSKVFEKLALTGEVRFKIDGKKIIVSP